MKTTQNQRTGSADRRALRADFTIEEIFQLTKIDRWFLTQMKEIVDFEEELAATKNCRGIADNSQTGKVPP